MRQIRPVLMFFILQIIFLGITAIAQIAQQAQIMPELATYSAFGATIAFALVGLMIFASLLLEPRWGNKALYAFLVVVIYGIYLIGYVAINHHLLRLPTTVAVLVLTIASILVLTTPSRRSRMIINTHNGNGTHEEPVIASKTGSKVHKEGCIVLDRIKKENRVTFDGISEAIRKGYTSCKVCLPNHK